MLHLSTLKTFMRWRWVSHLTAAWNLALAHVEQSWALHIPEWIFVGLASGIVLAEQSRLYSYASFIYASTVVALSMSGAVMIAKIWNAVTKRDITRITHALHTLVILVTACAIGGSLYLKHALHPGTIPQQELRNVRVIGTLKNVEYVGERWRVALQPQRVDDVDRRHDLGAGLWNVMIPSERPLKPGDTIDAVMTLRPYSPPLYPNRSDFRRYFWFRQTLGNGYVEKKAAPVVVISQDLSLDGLQITQKPAVNLTPTLGVPHSNDVEHPLAASLDDSSYDPADPAYDSSGNPSGGNPSGGKPSKGNPSGVGNLSASNLSALSIINASNPLDDMLATIETRRLRLTQRIIESLPQQPDHAAVIAALATGHRRAISQDVYNTIQTSGLAHLLSISGLHIGWVMMVTYLLVTQIGAFFFVVYPRYPRQTISRLSNPSQRFPAWMPVRAFLQSYKTAGILSIVTAMIFAVFVGLSIPTQRSLIMALIVTIGLMIGRMGWPLRALTLAAIITVMIQPYALTEASFQLSFVAMAAIIGAARINGINSFHSFNIDSRNNNTALPKRSSRWNSFLGMSLGISLLSGVSLRRFPYVSQLLIRTFHNVAVHLFKIFLGSVLIGWFLTPLVAYHFHALQIYAPISNMIAIPLFGLLIMPCVIVLIIVNLLGAEADVFQFVSWVAAFPIDLTFKVAKTVSNWPSPSITPDIQIWTFGFVVVGVLMWAALRGMMRWYGFVLVTGFWVALVFTPNRPDMIVSADGDIVIPGIAPSETDPTTNTNTKLTLWLGQVRTSDYTLRAWQQYYNAGETLAWDWKTSIPIQQPELSCGVYDCRWMTQVTAGESARRSQRTPTLILTRSERTWRRWCTAKENPQSEKPHNDSIRAFEGDVARDTVRASMPPLRTVMIMARAGRGKTSACNNPLVQAFDRATIAKCGGLALYFTPQGATAWRIESLGGSAHGHPWNPQPLPHTDPSSVSGMSGLSGTVATAAGDINTVEACPLR